MRGIGGMPMYYGAKPKLFEYAKMMRRSQTIEEKLMWQILTSNEFLPYKFRRQHPISTFIADFYSHPLIMVIEIDGSYHLRKEQQEYDDFRDDDMTQLGISVVRFTNEDVVTRPEEVVLKLKNIIVEKSKL
jgi:very-short-patch-repair endonuclease